MTKEGKGLCVTTLWYSLYKDDNQVSKVCLGVMESFKVLPRRPEIRSSSSCCRFFFSNPRSNLEEGARADRWRWDAVDADMEVEGVGFGGADETL